MENIPNEIILIGGGKSLSEGISLGLNDRLKDKFVIAINYEYKYFFHTLMVFGDSGFYLPLEAKKSLKDYPDIYEELKKEPLIIYANDKPKDLINWRLPNTYFIKTKSVYNTNPLKEGFYCYDKKTEILTDKGWKLFKDLDKTEKVATLNIDTQKTEYQKPIKYYEFYYEGKMIHEQGKRLDLLVTPEHQILIKKGHNQKTKGNKLYFIEAKNLPKNKIMYKKFFPFYSSNKPSYFVLPALKNQHKNTRDKRKARYYLDKKIKMSHWLDFLGWYLSEGCCFYRKGGNYTIVISQTKKENIKKIKKCLKKCKFHFSIQKNDKNNKNFMIFNKQLYSFLKQFGHSHDKFIPKEFLNLVPSLLKILFSSLIAGDGTTTKGGRIVNYATSSKSLANDIYELGLKLGYCPTLTIRKNNTYKNKQNKIVNRNKQHKKMILYVVYFSKTPYTVINRKYRKSENYNGKVYCVEVPNHTLYIRRNGKSVWCGNCHYMSGIYTLSLAQFLLNYEGIIFLLGMDWGAPDNKDRNIHHYTKEEINHRGVNHNTPYIHNAPNKYFCHFKEPKIKIYNVSPQSNIKNFEKIDYPTFFSKLNNVVYNEEELRIYIKEKLCIN